MKGVVTLVLIVLLLGLGAWLMFFQPPKSETAALQRSANNTEQGERVSDTEVRNPFAKTGSVEEPVSGDTADAVDPLTADERAEQLAAAKAQLDDLILEYNENLTDPDSREETQAQINALLKEYNELVLPVALAKINEN